MLTAGGSELDVGSVVVVDAGLGQHSVVLDLRSSELGGVVSQKNKFGFALSELLDGLSDIA